MVDLRQLRQFIAVAEELHFHRAAARLNMSQPPLTIAIRKLEDEIGVALIERGNRTLGLTAAGRVFLEEARQTLLQARRSVAAAQRTAAGQTGFVRLSYVGSALYGRLPDTIRAFRESHPEVRLELLEATTAQQVERVREGGTDIGLVIPPVADSKDLSFRPFDSDRLCMALPCTHALAGARTLSVGDLTNENFVLWPAAEGRSFHARVIRLCADAGFVPTVVQEAHGMHAVLSLVAVEAGVSIVPQSMTGFRNDRVIYRAIDDGDASFDLSLCFREPVSNPALAQFLKTTARPQRRSRSRAGRPPSPQT